MLPSLEAHSIDIWILLASVVFSCRKTSNKLWVMQVLEANYHWESNYEGNSKIPIFENFVCMYLLGQLQFLRKVRILSNFVSLNAIFLYYELNGLRLNCWWHLGECFKIFSWKAYDFYTLLLEFYWLTFKWNSWL